MCPEFFPWHRARLVHPGRTIKPLPSLRATFTNSLALVHPINLSSGFEIRGRCS
jgi:hypothetical protein